jgi:hypothetical protein
MVFRTRVTKGNREACKDHVFPAGKKEAGEKHGDPSREAEREVGENLGVTCQAWEGGFHGSGLLFKRRVVP